MELELKLIKNLTCTFIIPSYQRGYKWGKEEIENLLDDIKRFGSFSYVGNKSYCLQPLVVRKIEPDKFTLIDGQQRLTTIYLLFRFAHETMSGMKEAPFSIEYETRSDSGDFLRDLSVNRCEENIDFYFIRRAYDVIAQWFENDTCHDLLMNFYQWIRNNVEVIWYDVSDDKEQDDIKLFTRLNIGKIPLTNAELVKALFLCRSQNYDLSEDRRREIAFQWDNIEKELHDEDFWYFLTSGMRENYKTRIDLVLDIIAGKPRDSHEKYFTFFYFSDKKASGQNAVDIWSEIQNTFLVFKEWFKDHELYHKIGYLVVVGHKDETLKYVYAESRTKTKVEFRKFIDNEIRESIKLNGKNYADLSYKNDGDSRRLKNLLILFNIESVRNVKSDIHWFPFSKFRFSESKKDSWSLEHIHAQNSERIGKKDWKAWIELHIPFIELLIKNGSEDKSELQALLVEMYKAKEDADERDVLTEDKFDNIYTGVIRQLPYSPQEDEIHSISNLALLKVGDNAALGNAVFAVKRDKIIEMDKNGEYIPYCTKMVFLKYYSPSDDNQLLFWGEKDATSYVSKINDVLEKYLEDPIACNTLRRKA